MLSDQKAALANRLAKMYNWKILSPAGGAARRVPSFLTTVYSTLLTSTLCPSSAIGTRTGARGGSKTTSSGDLPPSRFPAGWPGPSPDREGMSLGRAANLSSVEWSQVPPRAASKAPAQRPIDAPVAATYCHGTAGTHVTDAD